MPARIAVCVLTALAICPVSAHGAASVRLKAEETTTLHVGETATVQFGAKALHSIGSGSGALKLIKQLTTKDGSKVYVYRAMQVGPDTLVATPDGLPAGHCISCVTRHYFVKVVP
jgi:hypothetical protein